MFQVVPHATLSPTQCATCTSVTGPFVDTALDERITWAQTHRIYLCAPCVKQFARELQMIDREKLEECEARVKELEEERDAERGKLVTVKLPAAAIASLDAA